MAFRCRAFTDRGRGASPEYSAFGGAVCGRRHYGTDGRAGHETAHPVRAVLPGQKADGDWESRLM